MSREYRRLTMFFSRVSEQASALEHMIRVLDVQAVDSTEIDLAALVEQSDRSSDP